MNNVVLGGAHATIPTGIAIGRNCTVEGPNAIAIGFNTHAKENEVCIGEINFTEIIKEIEAMRAELKELRALKKEWDDFKYRPPPGNLKDEEPGGGPYYYDGAFSFASHTDGENPK